MLETASRRGVLKAGGGVALLSGTTAAESVRVTQEETDDSNPKISDGIWDVHYPEGFQSEANQTLEWAQTMRENVRQQFPDGVGMGEKRIRIYLNEGDVGGLMNWNSSPYRIHAQVIQNSRMGELQYRQVLAHEFMNIVLNYHSQRYSNTWPRSPLWFREGLSDIYSYNHTADEIYEERFPTRFIKQRYKEIKSGFGYFELVTQNRYSGGYLLLSYTIEEFGLQPVFDVIAKNGDWESDIAEALGVSYDEWRRGWLSWAEDNIGGTYNAKVAYISELDTIIGDQQETITQLKESTAPAPSIATVVQEIETGQTIDFRATIPSDTGVTTVNWTFGDGTTATGAETTHSYETSGTYTVQMMAQLGSGDEITKSRELTVVEGDTVSGEDESVTATPTEATSVTDTSTPTESGQSKTSTTATGTTPAGTGNTDTRKTETTEAEGPGLGLPAGLSALGGLSYMLKKRFTNSAPGHSEVNQSEDHPDR